MIGVRPLSQVSNHILNPQANTYYYSSRGNQEYIEPELFLKAVQDTHSIINQIITNVPVNIFEILGMRNLSAFIGELFARSFATISNGRYMSNPHQDGYPDLLLLDQFGLEDIQNIINTANMRDKAPFSPFANGGLEVKATCGTVPTPSYFQARGQIKPHIGDQRVSVLKSYDWKAHHRGTNNLIGLLWDFVDGVPYIVAVFFGVDLAEEHWGRIIQPTEGGGRTTSVSIMTKQGVAKMFENLVLIENNQNYIDRINHINRNYSQLSYSF